jgi:hypothetical protein
VFISRFEGSTEYAVGILLEAAVKNLLNPKKKKRTNEQDPTAHVHNRCHFKKNRHKPAWRTLEAFGKYST